MTRDPRQIRRLRLLVGIILGVLVGTAHALVSHVVSRHEPVARSGQPYLLIAPSSDVSTR